MPSSLPPLNGGVLSGRRRRMRNRCRRGRCTGGELQCVPCGAARESVWTLLCSSRSRCACERGWGMTCGRSKAMIKSCGDATIGKVHPVRLCKYSDLKIRGHRQRLLDKRRPSGRRILEHLTLDYNSCFFQSTRLATGLSLFRNQTDVILNISQCPPPQHSRTIGSASTVPRMVGLSIRPAAHGSTLSRCREVEHTHARHQWRYLFTCSVVPCRPSLRCSS